MKLLMPLLLYQKLCAYIGAIDEEVGLMGKIHTEDTAIVLDDIALLPQTVTGVHVQVDHAGLAKFFDSLVAKGEKIGGWKMWIHSHPTFEAYFSPTDEDEIASFDNETAENNWILALVINQKGEYKLRLQVFQPFPFIEENIELIIQYPPYEDMETLYAEVTEKVNVQKFDVKKSNWPWAGKGKSGFENGIVGEDEDYVHALPETVPTTPIDQHTYDTNYHKFDYRKEFKKKYKNKKRR